MRHGAFSFVNKNAIKHGKNAPFLCIGHFFRSPYVVKTPFGAFFHQRWGIFSFRGVGNPDFSPGKWEGTGYEERKGGGAATHRLVCILLVLMHLFPSFICVLVGMWRGGYSCVEEGGETRHADSRINGARVSVQEYLLAE